MYFKRIDPPDHISSIVECYWIIENDDPTPAKEKIIPDGFAELIFHYGDPYRISIDGNWSIQAPTLLAGQIDKHFFLENTGRSGIFGIKLQPTALANLFGLNMKEITNKVIDLSSVEQIPVQNLSEVLVSHATHKVKLEAATAYFENARQHRYEVSAIDAAVKRIFLEHGMISVAELTEIAHVGERQLENLFKKYVGLSPKLFARIIRFSYIFELIKEQRTWSDLAYEAAFYDQSHFIRNFKDFTGENPADYQFDNKSMANFFLRKNEFNS
jgi:AraC-like DNA-binding protein